MSVVTYISDKLSNFVANLGTSRDKAAHSFYGVPVLNEEQLSNAYRGAWLPRKIIDIPALDACREWRSWQASKEQIDRIEAEEKRLGVRLKILEAQIKGRLFGGAAVYISINGDSATDQPLRVESVKRNGISHLTVITKRRLAAGEIEKDPDSEEFGKPKYYELSGNGRQVQIHPSRLVRFIGNPLPDDDLHGIADQGWGDSILLPVLEDVKRSDGTLANVASLVFESKINVFRIPNLMDCMGDEQQRNKLLERFRLAGVMKGINGDLVLDKEEEFEQRQVSFGGLPDIIDRFMQAVSGAADIPMTRLLGQSPAGLSATGESDLRNYYDRIRSSQSLGMTPAMGLLDECLLRSALGSRPPEIHYTWNPLWQPTAEQRSKINKETAETLKTITETRLFNEDALADAAVNMLVENGVMPGLESAIAEHGIEREEEDVDPAQQLGDAKPRTLYVQRKVINADELIAWAKAQGFEATLPAEDLHVTIAFSRTPVDWMKAGQAWSDDKRGTLTVSPGGARLVEKFDGGAVVLLFNASELSWRHEAIKEAGASWDWPDYQPHITLTYAPGDVDVAKVTPYRGAIELGPEIFEELDETWRDRVTEE